VSDDPSLRRIERTAVLVCLGMALSAWIAAGPWAAFGVLGGGLLSAFSYRTIASAVSAVTAAMTPRAEGDRRVGFWKVLKVGGRYALLTLLAYVMIARLRLHPLGLLAGASSVVAAIALEALRIVVKRP
jgi:hypothetical protein